MAEKVISHHVVDGEPIKIGLNFIANFTCCDCALTHHFAYAVETDKEGYQTLTVYIYRDEYKTKVARKRRGITGIRKKPKRKEE
ncbi:hypothetical protein LCGC14_1170050 [marine sediment metagenome]|uniref:Uncharacterized protein n=1 Tax=marine sediment metagenome TaxID=412755 RepID=A0A0F9PVL6_9ZZZZ